MSRKCACKIDLQWCQENVFGQKISEGPEFEACVNGIEQADKEDEQTVPWKGADNYLESPRCGDKSALIFLHGLGAKMTTMCRIFIKLGSD